MLQGSFLPAAQPPTLYSGGLLMALSCGLRACILVIYSLRLLTVSLFFVFTLRHFTSHFNITCATIVIVVHGSLHLVQSV
jgi:hypothetical protein